MIGKTSVLSVEIAIEKSEETELRCINCGKKLLTVEKTGAFSSKNACFVINTKCSRCGRLNHFTVK